MDRPIVYPGEVLADDTLLTGWRDTMIAIGYALQSVYGANTVVAGLQCTPTSPASMQVNVGPGSIAAMTVVDNLSYGSLGTDTTDPLMKMGINLQTTQFTLTAPGSNSQYYLISAAFSEQDAGSTLLPYYNAANPAVPYSGPDNDGASQNTLITQTVALTLTAGTPSATPAVPSTPSGQVALYTILVTAGQTSITSGNIAAVYGAPFNNYPLQSLTPGVSHMMVYTPANQGTWTVPIAANRVRIRVWGGGGAGGLGSGGAGGGGAGGGYAENYFALTPGTQYDVTVGGGGVGSGGAGGNSSVGSLISATGGSAGGNGSSGGIGAGGASPGSGTSGSGGLAVGGQGGGYGFPLGSGYASGAGGGSFTGGGAPGAAATSGNVTGENAQLPGGGGGGGVGSGVGGAGGAGLVLIEW